MSEYTVLYVFIFLMVSNLALSILYAVGTRPLRQAMRRGRRPKGN